MQEFLALKDVQLWSDEKKIAEQVLYERFCCYMMDQSEDPLCKQLWQEYSEQDFEKVPVQLLRVIEFVCRYYTNISNLPQSTKFPYGVQD